MKNFSILPTEENALGLLMSNSLGRNDSVFRFLKLIDVAEGPCSIALNGEWGGGKTLFVRQTKLVLDSMNPQSKIGEDVRQKIKGKFGEDNCSSTYVTLYYDAWDSDNHDDPILSIMYSAIQNSSGSLGVERQRDLVSMVGSVAETLSCRSVTQMFDKLKGDNPLDSIERAESIRSQVHSLIDELIREKGNQLVIFVDELDRCRPSYAIQLLERIKHYFDDDRVLFVFSVNMTQLQHTVKAYYGESFDSTRYLDKFFDLRIAMPEINYDQVFREKFPFIDGNNIYDLMCTAVAKYFHFSLRECERYVRLILISAYSMAHNNRRPHTGEDRAHQLTSLFIVPYMIGLSMVDMEAYDRFVAGEGCEQLCDILTRSQLISDFVDYFVSRNAADTPIEIVKCAYRALFAPSDETLLRGQGETVGSMRFTDRSRHDLMEMVALLSPAAEYDFDL